MPQLTRPEVHLPELHLPEMSRDDIARVIGDVRRDVDFSRLDPRRIDLPEVDLTKVRDDLAKVEMPKIDLSEIDVPRFVADATKAAGIATGLRRPSRLPIVIGVLVTLTIVGIALATSPMFRPRLEAIARKARERLDARMEGRDGRIDDVTVPTHESPFRTPTEPTVSDAPAGEMSAPEIATV